MSNKRKAESRLSEQKEKKEKATEDLPVEEHDEDEGNLLEKPPGISSFRFDLTCAYQRTSIASYKKKAQAIIASITDFSDNVHALAKHAHTHSTIEALSKVVPALLYHMIDEDYLPDNLTLIDFMCEALESIEKSIKKDLSLLKRGKDVHIARMELRQPNPQETRETLAKIAEEEQAHSEWLVPLNASIDAFRQWYCDALKGTKESYLNLFKWKFCMYSTKERKIATDEKKLALYHDLRCQNFIETGVEMKDFLDIIKDNQEAIDYEIVRWSKFQPWLLRSYMDYGGKPSNERIRHVIRLCGWFPSCAFGTFIFPTSESGKLVRHPDVCDLLADNGVHLTRVVEEYVIKGSLIRRECPWEFYSWLYYAQRRIKVRTGIELIYLKATVGNELVDDILEIISDYVVMFQ